MYDKVLNFGLGEELDQLRATVRRFAQDRIAPIISGRRWGRSACSASPPIRISAAPA